MKTRPFKMLPFLPLALALAGCSASNQVRTDSSHQQQNMVTIPENAGSLWQDQSLDQHPADRPDTPVEAPRPKSNQHDPRYDVSLAQIRECQHAGDTVLIDARGPDQFAEGHLRGAINVPAGLHEAQIAHLHQEYRADQPIIVYCSSAFCEAGNTVCDYLRSQGFTNVRVYKPGWTVLALASVDRTRD